MNSESAIKSMPKRLKTVGIIGDHMRKVGKDNKNNVVLGMIYPHLLAKWPILSVVVKADLSAFAAPRFLGGGRR
jgi:hypothetical protein